jgi:hypothetical protein
MTRVSVNLDSSNGSGRAFLSSDLLQGDGLGNLESELAAELERTFVEEDDAARMALLEMAVKAASLTVDVYPGESVPAEYHAFVDAPAVSSNPIFACVLAPPAVLDLLISEPPHFVLETATFQALDHEATSSALTSGLEAWVRRAFPSAPVPAIHIRPWPGPHEPNNANTLELLKSFPVTRIPSLEWKSSAIPPRTYVPPKLPAVEKRA